MTYLVLVGGSHVLDNLLTLGFRNAPLFGNNLAQNCVDFSSHIGCISTDINVCFLLKEFVDFLGPFFKTVLNINLLAPFSRKCGDQFEFVT